MGQGSLRNTGELLLLERRHSSTEDTTDLLLTLFTQVFQQMPELMPPVVPEIKWRIALLPNSRFLDWTESDLQTSLRPSVLQLGSTNQRTVSSGGWQRRG